LSLTQDQPEELEAVTLFFLGRYYYEIGDPSTALYYLQLSSKSNTHSNPAFIALIYEWAAWAALESDELEIADHYLNELIKMKDDYNNIVSIKIFRINQHKLQLFGK